MSKDVLLSINVWDSLRFDYTAAPTTQIVFCGLLRWIKICQVVSIAEHHRRKKGARQKTGLQLLSSAPPPQKLAAKWTFLLQNFRLSGAKSSPIFFCQQPFFSWSCAVSNRLLLLVAELDSSRQERSLRA